MKKNSSLFILFAMFFLSLSVTAQEEQVYSLVDTHLHYRSLSLEDGLSNPNITCLATNGHGVLWVGTDMGLNVIVNGHIMQLLHYYTENGYYDIGHVNSIACSESSNVTLISTENGLLSHILGSYSFKDVLYGNEKIFPTAVYSDDESALILSKHDGRNIILKYDFGLQSLSLLVELKNVDKYTFSRILKVKGDESAILLADADAGIFRLDTKSWNISRISHLGENINPNTIYQDMFGTLWIAYHNKGVVGYKPDQNYQRYKVFNTANSPLPHNNVTSISETADCFLCLATDGGGIVFIDKQLNQFRLSQHHYVLQASCIMRLGVDLLVGTPHHGLVLVRENNICVLNKNNLSESSRFSSNVVLSFCQDKDAVWCGTVNGINRYNEIDKSVTSYPSTDGMQITAMISLDNNRLLFFSRYDKFYILDKNTGNITPFHPGNKDLEGSPSAYQNLLMCHAGNNNIYLANCNNKNFIYNISTGNITEFALVDSEGQTDRNIGSIIPTYNGVLLTTLNSIYEITGNSSTARLLYSGQTRIYTCSADANNNLWFVNDDGLYMYNYLFKEIDLVFPSFPDCFFTTLLIDKVYNKIWLATSDNHLLVFDPNSKIYHYYSQEDGLALKNMYYNNTFSSDNGLLYFPGSAGLTVIRPVGTLQALRVPRPMYAISVQIESDGSVLSSKNNYCKLPRQYVSAIINVALDQPNPLLSSELRYCVKKGSKTVLEQKTVEPYLKLNNFESGRYTLYIQMFSRDGWSEPEEILTFRVPYSIARVLMTLFTLLILSLIFVVQFEYAKKNRNVKFSKEILKTQKDTQDIYVRQMNGQLFGMIHKNINIYHNINKYLKKILKESSLAKVATKDILYLIRYVDHAKNILSLINETNNPLVPISTFKIENVNFGPWLDNILSNYRILAKLKGLELKTVYDPNISTVNIDPEKLEAVISVFVDNAITYSGDEGQIQIVTSYSSLGNIKLSVIDEGCGIMGDVDNIFSPHVREHTDIPGTGISLHSVKVLMERMGGSVGAYNNQNKGATFFIYIPTTLKADVVQNDGNSAAIDGPAAANNPINDPEQPAGDMSESMVTNAEEESQAMEHDPFINQYNTLNPETEFNTLGYTLLVVDDQQDNLDFLQEEYADLFKEIFVAHDGVEGLEMIHKHYPNIVVSDILMPRMNGFEMCKAVKSDLDISHLPVVLLTSRNDSSFQDVGYKLGADAFVPKPFDTKMLYNILKTQLRNRFEIKRQYAITGLPEITEEYTFSLADEKFVKKLNQYISDNLSNPALSLDMIVEHMCVSRSTLFNKMRSLCGVTSNKYIRKVRIERAKELLSKTDRSVFEIAIDTGFTESQYFSTVFKQEVGVTPSQFRANLVKNEKTDR